MPPKMPIARICAPSYVVRLLVPCALCAVTLASSRGLELTSSSN